MHRSFPIAAPLLMIGCAAYPNNDPTPRDTTTEASLIGSPVAATQECQVEMIPYDPDPTWVFCRISVATVFYDCTGQCSDQTPDDGDPCSPSYAQGAAGYAPISLCLETAAGQTWSAIDSTIMHGCYNSHVSIIASNTCELCLPGMSCYEPPDVRNSCAAPPDAPPPPTSVGSPVNVASGNAYLAQPQPRLPVPR